ncbi:MAG: polysaccharide biosynthesis/export family protein [Bacteroidales bacterium]
MSRTFYKFMLLLSITVLSSCASTKKISYLQNTPNGYQQKGEDNYEIRVRPDDLISIMVNSKDPELAQMFNLPLIAYQMNDKLVGQNRVLGYLVDKEGKIDFPQLGTIKIGGMTRSEITEYIKNQIITKGYFNDPIVTVQFLNFKVSVMGEVTRPGTIEVPSDRITIFDALSAAGDLTIYGKRENVKVIREINGKKTVSLVDLRDANILDSPFYYLQQNDVVYVEPNKAKAGQREINQNRSVGTWATIGSVLISIATLIVTLAR